MKESNSHPGIRSATFYPIELTEHNKYYALKQIFEYSM